MDPKLTYLPSHDFPLRWRFFEDAERYTILPEEDRLYFKPLSKVSSQMLWEAFARRILENLDPETPATRETDKGEWQDLLRKLMRGNIDLPDTEPLYFFWEPTVAIATTWGILTKYWDDFCYPSDCGNVAIIPTWPKAIVYSNEKSWIVPRNDVPYTREEIDRVGEHVRPWRGPYCRKCRNHIPQFAVISPEDERHLKSLFSTEAFRELRERTGCSLLWAKLWINHLHDPYSGGPPCPHCGSPMRTAKAQQCFTCGADWHGRSA